jgi:hypothetical protein
MLARDKHPISLEILIVHDSKKCYNIGPWCQCYKTFSSMMLWQNKVECVCP